MRIKSWILVAMVLSLLLLAVASPIDVLVIADEESDVYFRPVPIGARFILSYIHSVEKTLVEDDYRIVGKRIWSWEERVLSQNAGMPFVTPRNGRLIMDGKWLRFRGGRYMWSVLFYRVGNETFGMNEFFVLPPYTAHYKLFKIFPSKRLRFSVSRFPLIVSIMNAREF
ncbi:MAG: hypothetical protein STSR0007_10960 [Thermovirga sp.]